MTAPGALYNRTRVLHLSDYRLGDERSILTPALLAYPQQIERNIDVTLQAMGGDANRWRPHLKTVKMPSVLRRLLARGVDHFKCATTKELRMACEAGAPDVLLAFPVVGANARRVREIAERYPGTRVSVLTENLQCAAEWRGSRVSMFLDVNPGMDRTGVAPLSGTTILELARGLGEQFRGLHFYDGHIHDADFAVREQRAHDGYDRLLECACALENGGVHIEEVITSGTPAFPASMSYRGFAGQRWIHRASPGTVLLNDITSLAQLPASLGYCAAAVVMTTVVSHPAPLMATCDGGHKSVSADAGVPTCAVIGRDGLEPRKPSEEHLPLAAPNPESVPAIGETLYLLPRHVCPTVNNFDVALHVENGAVTEIEPIAARGHD